jgi:hypothetical protein
LLGPALIGLAIINDERSSGGSDLTYGLVWTGGAAMIATPSAGRWYAGEVGVAPMLIRTAGAAVILFGVGQAFSNIDCEPGERCNDDNSGAIALVGSGMLIGGTIYDIVTAGDAARRYNHNHRNNSTLSSLSVAPIAHRSNSTGNVTGLSLTGSF